MLYSRQNRCDTSEEVLDLWKTSLEQMMKLDIDSEQNIPLSESRAFP